MFSFVFLWHINLSAMKRISVLHCICLSFLFHACSTDVDLYADYKEVPVIYGVLDAWADTNFIKITRAFYVEGDPYESALNPDSSNYLGKLDVRLVEYCNGDFVREIVLDTLTIHDKIDGFFYAPSQKMYYTTERLPLNDRNKKYSYDLKVDFPNQTINTKADLVGDAGFEVQSLGLNFSKQYIGATSRRFLFHPAINAASYDVSLAFTYKELRTPDGDTLPRRMEWKIGTYSDYELAHNLDDNCYVFYYRPEVFYSVLEQFIGDDTAQGIQRFIVDYPAEVIITAGGNKLTQYIHMSESLVVPGQGEGDLSFVDGGAGVFSSKITLRRKMRLAGETVPDLLEEPHWGFVFTGGE